jgi:outer membrane protein TolC
MKARRLEKPVRWRTWALLGLVAVSLGLSGCQLLKPAPAGAIAVENKASFAPTEVQETVVGKPGGAKLMLAGFQPAGDQTPATDSGPEIASNAANKDAAKLNAGAEATAIDAPVALDLASALREAGVDNPTIALAQERIREALAGQLAARAMLMPSINLGSNFRLHRGALQDDPGFLFDPHSQGLFVGAGAGAVGTGAVTIPGVWLFSYLADAVYEPIVASQVVSADRAKARAVQNTILLNVSTVYLRLVAAEARVEILRQAQADINEIVRITTAFANSGEGAVADARRATANAEFVQRQIHGAEGDRQAAAARLAGLLSLDPSAAIRTPGGLVESFRLVDENADLDNLIAEALHTRPELAARAAEIQEAQTRFRQERARPWLPLVAVGYSAGAFGGGSNLVSTKFSNLQDRSDFSVLAAWNIQNLGVGNRARVSRAGSLVGQANAAYQAVVNQVRDEVASAQAAARMAARQAQTARSSLSAAEEAFRLDTERIRQGQGRPIEALDSFRQLVEARLELLRSIVAFDIAQMQLWVAMGSSPMAAAYSRANDVPPTAASHEPSWRQ